jgi:hypothetical protein
MAYATIQPQGNATVVLTANQRIVVQTQGVAQVYQVVGYPNYPTQNSLLQNVNNTTYTSSAFANGATVYVEAGDFPVFYEVGTSPHVSNDGDWNLQNDPIALNATGDLTAAMILGGIVTSTTAAAVTATPPTGALLDAATSLAVNDSVDFAVINTGGANAFTISVGGGVAGCTLLGNMAVAASSSGLFRARKTAAATYTIYRIAS